MLEDALVITDLDGTLLNTARDISLKNRMALAELAERRVIRVAATGRSLYSVRHVLAPEDPFDYVVFSSGAGIMDWRSQQLIHAAGLAACEIEKAICILLDEQVNFMVHDAVPDNHCFAYHEVTAGERTDFRERCDLYRDFARPFCGSAEFAAGASQLLAITGCDLDRLQRLRTRLADFSVIRTTSPLDHESLWIEVFPPRVNKAEASRFLLHMLEIHRHRTYALGNDYNDVDLLEWAARSLVTANAPVDLRRRFAAVTSNDNHALAAAVASWDDDLPEGD